MHKCRLCNKEYSEDIDSHIISKMFYNQIKKLGGMRDSSNVNKRLQDGYKIQFLCRECETLFSRYETYFSNNVYNKLLKNDAYELKLNNRKTRYFILSLHWRNLQNYIETSIANPEPQNGGITKEEMKKLQLTAEKWRKQLLKEKHFCILFNRGVVIKSSLIDIDEKNCVKTGDVVSNDIRIYGVPNSFRESYSYIAVSKIVFIMQLWRRTLRDALSKKSKAGDLHEIFISHLESIESHLLLSQSNISPNQLEKIKKRAKEIAPL